MRAKICGFIDHARNVAIIFSPAKQTESPGYCNKCFRCFKRTSKSTLDCATVSQCLANNPSLLPTIGSYCIPVDKLSALTSHPTNCSLLPLEFQKPCGRWTLFINCVHYLQQQSSIGDSNYSGNRMRLLECM